MKSIFLSLAFAACASTLAFAQTPPAQGGGMRSAFMAACGDDMKSYCASAQSREDRRACVTANKDKFSDSCKSFMSSHPMHEHPQQQGGQQ